MCCVAVVSAFILLPRIIGARCRVAETGAMAARGHHAMAQVVAHARAEVAVTQARRICLQNSLHLTMVRQATGEVNVHYRHGC